MLSCKHPSNDLTPGTPQAIFSQIWRLYTGHLVLIFIMAIGIQFLSRWLIDVEEHKITTLLESVPAAQFLLLAVIIAPLTEEIVFRLPLRFSRQNILISIVFMLIPVSGLMVQGRNHQQIVFWGLWGLIGAVLYGVWSRILCQINRRTGERWFARHLSWLVYGSSIVFGLLHLMNFPRSAWIAAPVLVLPQFTLGLLLAYVRIKFGFQWSVLTHGLHNFVASSPILLLALGSKQLQASFFERATEVKLSPQDYVLQGLFFIWVISLSIAV